MSAPGKSLPDSKRNELITEFQEGKTNQDYEVIPSKTQKGKYTDRKRKVAIPTTDNTVKENQDLLDDKTIEQKCIKITTTTIKFLENFKIYLIFF